MRSALEKLATALMVTIEVREGNRWGWIFGINGDGVGVGVSCVADRIIRCSPAAEFSDGDGEIADGNVLHR